MASKSGLSKDNFKSNYCTNLKRKVLFITGREKTGREKTQAGNPHEPQGEQYQARGTEPQEDRDKSMALPRNDLQALCSTKQHMGSQAAATV